MTDGSSDLVTLLIILAGVALSAFTVVTLARRARATRRRQLEEMPDAKPAIDRTARLRQELEADSDEPSKPESVPRAPEPALAAKPEPAPAAKPETVAPVPAPTTAAPAPVTAPEPVAAAPVAAPEPVAPAAAPTAPAPIATVTEEAHQLAPRPSKSAIPVERPVTRSSMPTASESAAPAEDKETATRKAAYEKGLEKTRSGWISKLGQLFAGKKSLDPNVLENLERVLFSADIGVKTATRLLDEVRESLSRKELADTEAVWDFIRARTRRMLEVEAPPLTWTGAKPFVLLIIGVNGAGKTTTIGKLASRMHAKGKKVIVAAADTFRAAAVEQLEVWASKAEALIVKGKEGTDPSSIIFEAIKKAGTENTDIVIADTAGRLHTKTDLMDELQKVRRVTGKAMEGAPHETWLVLDSTSGQNAIAQAEIFTKAMQVTGIVLTKLDGTARGGVVLGIADQLKIPVRFIGVGEGVEDLREFDAEAFVDALFGDAARRDTGAAA